MVAVKLHKNKNPFLGKGSYLIPIISWEIGKIQVKYWYRTLTDSGSYRPNNKINFISLVRIPASLPVALYRDFDEKCYGKTMYKPFNVIEQTLKQEIIKREEPGGLMITKKLTISRSSEEPLWMFPELILGQPLPASTIVWTKDIRLLYFGNKKNNHNG